MTAPHSPTDEHPERGAVAVEMALVLPILIVLVFGIITFGRAYHARLELTGAVREGARAVALGADAAAATVVVRDAAPSFTTPPAVTVVEACPPGGHGRARVRAEFSLPWVIPLLSSGTFDLSATGVMRCET